MKVVWLLFFFSSSVRANRVSFLAQFKAFYLCIPVSDISQPPLALSNVNPLPNSTTRDFPFYSFRYIRAGKDAASSFQWKFRSIAYLCCSSTLNNNSIHLSSLRRPIGSPLHKAPPTPFTLDNGAIFIAAIHSSDTSNPCAHLCPDQPWQREEPI